MRTIQKIMQTLRDVAETHPNDVIANAASALAARMEIMPEPIRAEQFTGTELDLIRYSHQWLTEHPRSRSVTA